MATYAPIQTGYKPEGALGGLYAGENAAMSRLQGDIANLADLFDLQQTGVTTQQKEFDLDKARQLLPRDLAMAEQQRLTALTESDPDVISALTAGKVGKAQTEKATGAFDTAMLPSKIGLGTAENALKLAKTKGDTYITEVGNVHSKLLAEGPLSAANYVNTTYQDPAQREVMHNLIKQGTKGFQSVFEGYAKAQPPHIQDMLKQTLVNQGNLDVENVRAKAQVNAAVKTAIAAITSGRKLELQAAAENLKYSIETAKYYAERVDGDLRTLIAQQKAMKKDYTVDPQYKALLKEKADAEKRVKDATDAMQVVANKLSEDSNPYSVLGIPDPTGSTNKVPTLPPKPVPLPKPVTPPEQVRLSNREVVGTVTQPGQKPKNVRVDFSNLE